MCKKLREDTQRLEKEKATLQGMVESHDELLMEIARETGLDRIGEDAEDEEEDEDADDGGDATAPPVPTPPAATPEEEEPIEMVHEQEAPVTQEVILADAEPKMPQPRLYHALMRDDFDVLDDDPNEGRFDIDESSSLNLKFRFKNNPLGFV
jgi:hypothetical protein